MLKKLRGNQRGFTVIELIIGLAVMGAFIVALAPKFLKVINAADHINIQNDIRQAENLAIVEIYENDFKVPGNMEIDNASLVKAIEDERVYNVRGLELDLDRIENNRYFKLDEQFVEDTLRSSLKGEFITTENAEVLYVEALNKEDNTNLIAKLQEVKDLVNKKNENKEEDLNIDDLEDLLDLESREELVEQYTNLLGKLK